MIKQRKNCKFLRGGPIKTEDEAKTGRPAGLALVTLKGGSRLVASLVEDKDFETESPAVDFLLFPRKIRRDEIHSIGSSITPVVTERILIDDEP